MRILALILGLLFVGLSNLWAQSEGTTRVLTIALPNKAKSIKKPSSDLMKDGQLLDVGEAAKMAENGFDLSTLDPKPEKMWQNKFYPTTDADTRGFPAASIGVKYGSPEAATKFTSMVRVQSNENKNLFFRLAVSRFAQPMMMRAALLRKLGYFIPSPKHYNNLKVTFGDEAEKQKFITQAQTDMGTDFESRKWILEDNSSQHFLILASASLEVTSADYFDLNWGLAPNPDDRAQAALVGLFSHNRAFRALIFPYAIADVPESVNRFSTEFGSVQTGFATISYFMAHSFQACDFADAQWLLKRLQKLTLKDYQEIVQEGHYPPEIDTLVLAKFVNRANSALSLFGLAPTVANLNVDFTSKSGLVTRGKVTQEFIPGWPQRFAHGERTSPYQEGDLARYLMMEGKSSLIASAAAKLNAKMQLATVADAANKVGPQLFLNSQIEQYNRTHPNSPFEPKKFTWGGPLGNFNVMPSRHIGTGTYSGSTAPVQLIDNLSMSAGFGLFRALDGIPTYVPSLGANISVSRSYTHVRPILSVEEAQKISWKNLSVPSYMKGLSEILTSIDKKNADGSVQKSLDAFLNEMRDGEVFTISDAIGETVGLNTSSTFDTLLGLQPFSFMNSITGGVDASRVTLRQVSIVRVVNGRFNGIQVYVRDLKNKARGAEVNLNYYFNFLKARAESVNGDIVSNGFLIEYNPAVAADSDPESEAGKKFNETRANLQMALLPLFRDNDTELLEAKFKNKKFVVNTNIQGKAEKLKFLAWKFANFKEDRLVNIEYPPSEKHPELNPKDEIVSLFSSRRGELKGRDLLGLGLDVLEGFAADKTQGDLVLSRGAQGDNPANVPLGNAYWRVINTEADISAKITPQLNSVATLQHVWGGWSLSREKFFQVLDQVKKQFENTNLAKYELINRGQFINVKSLDFYRITANLSVLGEGLNKIRDLILQPTFDDQNPQRSIFPLERLLKRLRHDQSPEKFRYANEKEMYSELMKLLGNDDQQAGYQAYLRACRASLPKTQRFDAHPTPPTYNGNSYECLSPWVKKLMQMGERFPADKLSQTKWMSEVLLILDEQIPMPQLLKYLGEENYIFLVRINGFRSGDEDGDQEFFSKTLGDPQKNFPEAGGLVNLYIKKTGLMPTELDRTMVGFQ